METVIEFEEHSSIPDWSWTPHAYVIRMKLVHLSYFYYVRCHEEQFFMDSEFPINHNNGN